MHYYVDGYNLLFRHFSQAFNEAPLQSQREQIIQDLSTKVQLLNLDITLVFDAMYQYGSATRSHYKQLEIVFTAQGETADEYILAELMSAPNPRNETVVTSDKRLAWHARRRAAKSESVEEFRARINQTYKNRQRHSSPGLPAAKAKTPSTVSARPPSPIPLVPREPKATDSAAACFDYYLATFQKSLEMSLAQEDAPRPKPNSQPKPHAKSHAKPRANSSARSILKRKSQNQDDLFAQTESAEEGEKETFRSDTDRWQKIFERKLKDL